ncbi:MAG: magnesium transporter [Armatimonadota bacterium]
MTAESQREWEEALYSALVQRDREGIAQAVEDVHAADLAEYFLELDEPEQLILLDALSDEQAATLLDELAPEEQAEVLDLLPIERTSDILDEMPPDEAADLLAELPTAEANALLERMEPEQADDVAELMRYPEDTAGGLMTKEFLAVGPDETAADVMSRLRAHHDDAEMIYTLYVLDEDERLLGEVTLRDLIVCPPDTPLTKVMRREYPSVAVDQPEDEVAEIVRRHDLLAVPVLDGEGRLQGIITVDDIGDVVQEAAAEDVLESGGGTPPAQETRPWSGLPGWRTGLLALAGGLLGAGVIWFYANLLSEAWKDVGLLLPLVLILGIFAGNQAALAMDRAYESAVERQLLARVFLREVVAGLALAFIGGLLAAAVIFVLHFNRAEVTALSIPAALGLWTAAIAGALGAVLLRRQGDRLSSASTTLIVVAALLLATVVYLVGARAMIG